MIGTIVIGSIFLLLFLLAFLTKVRWGILGLGLAAGVLLNQLVGAFVGPLINLIPYNLQPLTAKDIATIIVTLLPSLLLLITGPKQHGQTGRLITGALYALIATALVAMPLTLAFPVDNPMVRNLLSLIENIQLPILTFGVLLAIGDMLLPRRKA